MEIIARLMERMIYFSEGNIHDIDHLVRVWNYAKTIGELEGLDADTQYVLEVAAIVHDIACPLCREKYGNTNGKYQEAEGAPMAAAFLVEYIAWKIKSRREKKAAASMERKDDNGRQPDQ